MLIHSLLPKESQRIAIPFACEVWAVHGQALASTKGGESSVYLAEMLRDAQDMPKVCFQSVAAPPCFVDYCTVAPYSWAMCGQQLTITNRK